MSDSRFFNNMCFDSLALIFVLQEAKALELSKAFLILPIVTHRKMLSHLAHGSTRIMGHEKYIIENISYFINFNERYYDSITSTLNSLQFLIELDTVFLRSSTVFSKVVLDYENSMGKRARNVFKAARNISNLIADDTSELHLNMRIQL